MKYFTAAIVSTALFCLSASAADIQQYTLKDGRVISNPFVISKNPAGLEIAHDKGVMFIRYADMPEDIQKIYGYNPQAASDYEKTLKNVQVKKASPSKSLKVAPLKKKELADIEREMAGYELRAKYLKEEIDKLNVDIKKGNAEQDAMHNDIFELSQTPTTNVYWRGGFFSSSSKKNAVRKEIRERSREKRKASKELSAMEEKLKSYRAELTRNEQRRAELKRSYQNLSK